MAKVKKLFGNMPEDVHVLCEVAEFNVEGIAEVSDEALAVFINCPGYEVVEDDSEALAKAHLIEEIAKDAEEAEFVIEEPVVLKKVPRVKPTK